MLGDLAGVILMIIFIAWNLIVYAILKTGKECDERTIGAMNDKTYWGKWESMKPLKPYRPITEETVADIPGRKDADKSETIRDDNTDCNGNNMSGS